MQIFLSDHFKKQLERYTRKFRRLAKDLTECLKRFDQRQAVSLGKNTYKIRLASSDLNKGKSGAFRLIVHIIAVDQAILPIVIYFKSDREDMSREEINEHLTIVLMELKFI